MSGEHESEYEKKSFEASKALGVDGVSSTESGGVLWREKWKDPSYRGKCVYSVIMTATALATGMYVGQHGPTFLDIQILTDTDLEEASAFFTAGNGGLFVGCILTGLVYNKVNKPLLFFLTSIALGLTNIALPHCTRLELMAITRFASSAFVGSLATGTNAQHLAVWGPHGNGFLQLLHFGFSIGGLISPLIAEPFLLEKSIIEPTNTTANGTKIGIHGNHTSRRHLASESRVEYVFYITGVFMLFTALPYVFVYFSHQQARQGSIADTNRQFSRENVSFKLMIFMLAGVCLFYFVWNCVEPTFFAFLMPFLVEEYSDISKSRGAFITAMAWGTYASTRFLLIFLTRKFTPLQLMVTMSTMLVISFTAFSIFAQLKMVDALIVLAAISAIMMAGMFPVGISWVETELFQITGIVGSCILVSNSLGSMINPIFLGMLMKQRSNMWFCYLLLAQTVLAYFICISLVVFSRCYVGRKYGSLAMSSNRLHATLDVKSSKDHGGTVECESRTKFLK